jgi:hypothetical protein
VIDFIWENPVFTQTSNGATGSYFNVPFTSNYQTRGEKKWHFLLHLNIILLKKEKLQLFLEIKFIKSKQGIVILNISEDF